MSKTKVKRSLPHPSVRDMLVFLALSVLPIASFWLANYPNVSFYTSLLTMSMLVLFGFETYKPAREKLLYFEYDVNLNIFSLAVVIAGAIGMILFSTFWASAIHARSLLAVPMQKLALEYGQVSLPPFWSDTLYQITLVASAEEASKLAVIIGAFLWLKGKIGNFPAATTAVASVVGGWALLHTYQNPDYQGSTMWLMVFGAFIDGLIILAVLCLTKSWLATVITHFAYNFSILCTQYGVFSLAGSSAGAAAMVRSSTLSASSFDWTQIVTIWNNMVGLGNQIVNFIIQLIQFTTGIALAPWQVILSIIGVTATVLVIFGKYLAYVLATIGFIILICSFRLAIW
jgi:hypothetical protein